ncbi:anti-sigma-K factor RskA [Arcicella aurantiaca]|uniref:Anti-sigma-K factor RskA n=1 Tax=Arcicella aurantiaca TaxID=591202 RepID=A0A316DMX9_9BACT|nr:anti-sigma factor [Arcicella aurantiaca]PWK19421.1 anti-sigma-K factor RskA [Arcicella aurantiaca]
MNTKEYIESGILESYVLGVATAGESAEVERLALEYPAIRQELDAIRNSLETYALQYEKQPPAFLKDKIMDNLFNEHKTVEQKYSKGINQTVKEDIEPREVINLNQRNESSASQRSIFKMAASWVLLALSIGANIWFFKNWKNSEEKVLALESQNQILAKEGQTLKASYQEELAILQNPDVKIIKLSGQEVAPEAKALVYFDKTKQEVYLSALSLPEVPTGKQYQLWAIVDGKPVDAGMIDSKGNILKMKSFSNAVAFAISLENTGGSTTEAGPKGAVYVMGAV